jgi:hypothetical protein
VGKPKIIFKLAGSKEPEPEKEKEIQEVDDEISRLENLIAAEKGEKPFKPPKKKPDRRVIMGESVPFAEWAPLIKDVYDGKQKLIFAGESGRVDVLPLNEEEGWRITVLSYMGGEFSVTLFYGWRSEEYLNIKKHSIEFITKDSLIKAIALLLDSKHKF